MDKKGLFRKYIGFILFGLLIPPFVYVVCVRPYSVLSDDDFVGFRSLCALGIYGMDH